MQSAQQTHKPGALKQQNKSHKSGKHRSKAEVYRENKGRVDAKVLGKKAKNDLSKNDRKNRDQQLRKTKREEILNVKRSIGSPSGTPHVVTVIPLASDVDCAEFMEHIVKSENDGKYSISATGIYSFNSTKFKTQFNFVLPNASDWIAVLDAVKGADTCTFLFSSETGIDDFGRSLFDTIFHTKLPTSVFVAQNMTNQSKNSSVRQNIQKFVDLKYPSDSKILNLSNESDASKLLFKLSQNKIKDLKNNLRSYLLADKYEFTPDKLNEDIGSLTVYGFLRGNKLNVNNLVHLPLLGTFNLQQIDVMETYRNNSQIESNWTTMAVSDPARCESLRMVPDAENRDEVNDMDMEGSEQVTAEDANIVVKKKLVPKGTSEYQAAWILDSDEEEDGEDDDEDEEDDADEEDDEEQADYDAVDELGCVDEHMSTNQSDDEEMKTHKTKDDYDAQIDMDEEMKTLKKIKEAKINEEFPNEVDTPMDVSARVKFEKYRGLKSFRSSPWSTDQFLPDQYSQIYQFENFKRTLKKLINNDNEGVEPGYYVRVVIKDVPKFEIAANKPLVVFGLLKYENKMSVMNLVLKRVNQGAYDLPIKSKERLIFHIGARRFACGPIFSQHTTGDKQKLERFMPKSGAFVATIIAPITYPPSSVTVFKETKDGDQVMIANGSILSVNPNRVVLKQVLLSGAPYKLNKKSAVIRYMFFNPDDINWFKPIELRTKHGRVGHIKETLGTHGHMKCVFNGPIKSHDTVTMSLYKRVFPRYNYEEISIVNHNKDTGANLDENHNVLTEV